MESTSVVPPNYNMYTKCTCAPPNGRNTNSPSDSYDTDAQFVPNANSHILQSILSMRVPQDDNNACNAVMHYNNVQAQQARPSPRPETNMAALGVPTPPPSEPGSPYYGPMSPTEPEFRHRHCLSPVQIGPVKRPLRCLSQDNYQGVVYERQQPMLPVRDQISPVRFVPSPQRPHSRSSLSPAATASPNMEQMRNNSYPNQNQCTCSGEGNSYENRHREAKYGCVLPRSQGHKRDIYESSEPMDLSCPKKPRWDSEPHTSYSVYLKAKEQEKEVKPNPHHHHQERLKNFGGSENFSDSEGQEGSDSDSDSGGSILMSILQGQSQESRASPTSSIDSEDSPPNSPVVQSLSSCHGLIRSPQERVYELINRARAKRNNLNKNDNSSDSIQDNHQAMPPQQEPKRVCVFNNHETIVQLAKKNLLPVTARVSDWLLKIIRFAKSQPEFTSLPPNDMKLLLQNSWSRLLLLYMAETYFQFAVTPTGVAPKSTNLSSSSTGSISAADLSPSEEEPTVRSAEGIQAFIKKCQIINVTPQEISYLRLLTLFNHSYLGVESSEYIENINKYIRNSLQEYCVQNATENKKPPNAGKLRYSQLLLTLPALFGTSPRVMQKLFCRQLTVENSMEEILIQMFNKEDN